MDMTLSANTSSATAATTASTATGSSASAKGGSKAAANGFSAALNGLLSTDPQGSGTNAASTLPLLPVLIQVMNQLTPVDQTMKDQLQSKDLVKQLDALIELLDAKDESADELLQNPDIQAWLAQMQMLLQQLQPDAVNLSGQELKAAGVTESLSLSQISEGAVQKPLTKAESLELLNQLKQAITDKSSSSPLVESIKKSLGSLLEPKESLPANGGQADTAQPLAKAASAAPPTMEWLAAKTNPVKHEAATAGDEPLFEPLIDLQAASNDTQAVPLHEYVKQASTGAHVAKTPVLVANAPTFAEDMAQLVLKSFKIDSIAEGITEAKISLYPQHLGQVDVKLTMQNGQLVAQFMAEHAAGKEMLESQLAQLRTTLQSQGIHVEKLEVTQSSSLQSGMFQEQRQQQPQSQSSSKQQKGGSINKAASIEDELAQLASEVRPRNTSAVPGFGRTSIDTTA